MGQEGLAALHLNDSVPCPSESYIETPGIIQETNSLMFIGSDARQNDEILLSPLESINASNFHFLK